MARIQNRYILRDGATADLQPRDADLWSGTEEHLAIARLNNGSVIEVWDHWAAGAHRLFGRMVSASGQAQGGSFLVGFERNAEGGLATGSCRSGR